MSHLLRVILGLVAACFTLASPVVNAAPLDWQPYADFLARHVTTLDTNSGVIVVVDYAAVANDAVFGEVVAQVEKFDTEALQGREEKLAFYLNAYNIFAIKMVADHWPLESIKDVGSLFFSVWKKSAGTLAGESISLDTIEHKILRPMGDPRIHIGLVCASKGCPNLRAEPYRADVLSAQLDEQARQFLSNSVKGLRVEGGHIRISKIFDWFEKDFEASGGVRKFIDTYHAGLPESLNFKANLPYDWSVNGQK